MGRMRPNPRLAAGLLLAALLAAPAGADIYTYVDENGVRHFSNAPTSARYEYAGPEIEKDSPGSRSPNRFDPYIREAATLYRLDFALLKAMVCVESNFNPSAVSAAGAMGLMQIMPANCRDLQIYDPYDPRENIMAGARYFRSLLTRFGHDTQLSLAAYNAGPNAVERYDGIPPYDETRNYVKRVMSEYIRYKTLESGS